MLIDCGQPIFPPQQAAVAAFDLSIDWPVSLQCFMLIFDSIFDSLFFQSLLLEMPYSFEILNLIDSDSKLVVLVPQLQPSNCATADDEMVSISWLQRTNQRINSLRCAYPNSSRAAV